MCRYTIADYFFKIYIDKVYKNYYPAIGDKVLPTQNAFARASVVTQYEESLFNTIKRLSTLSDLPWHLIDEVFVLINYDNEFYWVLRVIALKERCIRVYDSMSSSRNREQSSEVQKLAIMLSSYLQYSNFFEQKVPTGHR